MFKGIDLSSDTATKPTEAMKAFMFQSELGDEQLSEDPTTLKLENMAAEMFGFESAIFLPSATMANIISMCSLSNPGNILIAAENAHILLAECGGVAIHARVMTQSLPTETGVFHQGQLLPYLNKIKKLNYPSVGVISIENTVNYGGGYVWAMDELRAILEVAHQHQIKTHLDGSRIFNASVYLNKPVHELTAGFDMVTVCLSKGLGCPMGALLVYNKSEEEKVRFYKKLMGGAMRQSGIIAGAGIYAFKNNIARLKEDHSRAKQFANELNKMTAYFKLLNASPMTNIVNFELVNYAENKEAFFNYCQNSGFRFSQVAENKFRAVFHQGIADIDLEYVIEAMKKMFAN